MATNNLKAVKEDLDWFVSLGSNPVNQWGLINFRWFLEQDPNENWWEWEELLELYGEATLIAAGVDDI